MGNDVEKHVSVPVHTKIEAPVVVYSRLPDIGGFVVLLSAEGRIAEVLQKKDELLVKKLLDTNGSASIAPLKGRRKAGFHLFVLSFFACRWR